MELTFLGTGTSQGVPIINQPDDLGWDSSNPKNWRTRPCIHIEMDGHHIQVDASQEFRLQCLKYSITRVDTVLLTHGHADHILGMDDMRRFCDLLGGIALPVYGNQESLDRMQNIFPYAIMEKPKFKGYPAFSLKIAPKVIETPGGTIETTVLPHGLFEVLGFVFTEKSSGKKIAYYTDCNDVPEEAQKLAEGADILILDALRPNDHPSHMTLSQATDVALKMDAPQTYFTHMTCLIDHESTESTLPTKINLAYDGLRCTI